MKRFLSYLLLVLPFCFFSCDSEEVDGKWPDIIEFNTREATFDSDGGMQKITSKGDWWWILEYISINGESIHLMNDPEITVEMGKIKGWDNPNVIYDEGADMEIKKIEGPWYTITKDGFQTLIIETKPNDTNLPRSFILHIEAGNYFDYIQIFQSAE